MRTTEETDKLFEIEAGIQFSICETLEGKKGLHTDRWYDRSSRNWIVQLLDENGYQIGTAVYVYSKQEAIEAEKQINQAIFMYCADAL